MNRPIKVLWLIKGLGPGGAERLLVSSARARDAGAFDIEVAYLLRRKSDLAGDLENLGLPVHCLDAGSRESDFRWALRLRRLLAERRYDIVHVHSPYVAGAARLIVRSLPRATRPKLVYTEHLPWFGYRPATRAMNAVTYLLDDVQLAVSRAVVDSVPRAFRRRLRVVHQGIETEKVRQALTERSKARRELGVVKKDVLVGTVANYREQKDYPNLFAAASRVIEMDPVARFVAVGQGPLQHEIERRHAAAGFGDRFLLLGRREDVPRVLAACDVFVLASKNEGLPISLLEALALGLPVVATGVGGTPEAVTHGMQGLLVSPSRPGLLAAALARLIADPDLRKRMSAAAAERSSKFDISKTVEETEAIYRGVFADRR